MLSRHFAPHLNQEPYLFTRVSKILFQKSLNAQQVSAKFQKGKLNSSYILILFHIIHARFGFRNQFTKALSFPWAVNMIVDIKLIIYNCHAVPAFLSRADIIFSSLYKKIFSSKYPHFFIASLLKNIKLPRITST